jgi:hypothetical protein
VFLLLSSCTEDTKYSNAYLCSFVFYTQNHPTSLLTRALGNVGTFVIVTSTQRQGINHLMITAGGSNETEDIPMTTAIENERVNYKDMGANRSLIVGLSNFDGLKAYDRQCPNCMEAHGGTNYPLSFSDNGQSVTCPKCHTIYNLNAEGMPTNGQQGNHALLQYKVVYDGSRLYVHN